MKFILDVHCHTVSSGHAYSTITENAAHAAQIGLTHIGISDHGPAMPDGPHLYSFLNLNAIPKVIHGVNILRGVEANILSSEGELDIPARLVSSLDFVIASMHRGVLLADSTQANTRALVNAALNPHVNILGHPNNSAYSIDIEPIIEAAAKTGTVIEINNNSLTPGSFRYFGEDEFVATLELCKQYGVSVLASSDAHYCTGVGNFEYAHRLIIESGISEELVVNTSIERFLAAIARKKGVKQ